MKKLIIAFIAILLISCEPAKVVNRQVESEKDGKLLLGRQTLSQFNKEPFSEWYSKEHDSYTLDTQAIQRLKKEKLNSYKLTVFLGTWCEDSHREFPRLMKILEALKYPKGKLSIIAVSRKKESPEGEEVKYGITRVPTIIVSKYGEEVGRITEAPQSGFLERDLLQIIQNK